VCTQRTVTLTYPLLPLTRARSTSGLTSNLPAPSPELKRHAAGGSGSPAEVEPEEVGLFFSLPMPTACADRWSPPLLVMQTSVLAQVRAVSESNNFCADCHAAGMPSPSSMFVVCKLPSL
jgi:hypothetical protein